MLSNHPSTARQTPPYATLSLLTGVRKAACWVEDRCISRYLCCGPRRCSSMGVKSQDHGWWYPSPCHTVPARFSFGKSLESSYLPLGFGKLRLARHAQIMQVPLVYFEFFRRYQASPLFPLYLTIVTICDIARVRTFAFTALHTSPLFCGTSRRRQGHNRRRNIVLLR